MMSTDLDRQFIQAIEQGNVQAVTDYIQQGGYINVPINEHKDTPLILAAKEGQIEVIKTLIKNGSKLDLRDKDNKTAYEHLFHYICSHAPSKKPNKIDVNTPNTNGNFPSQHNESDIDTNIPTTDINILVSLYGRNVLSCLPKKTPQKTISKKEMPVYIEVLNQLAVVMPRAKSQQNIPNQYLFSKNIQTK